MKKLFYIFMFILGLVQFAAIINGFTHSFGPFLGMFIALILGEMPILGTIMGIIGAINNWGWSPFQAILLFFGLPVSFFIINIFFSKKSVQSKYIFKSNENQTTGFNKNLNTIKNSTQINNNNVPNFEKANDKSSKINSDWVILITIVSLVVVFSFVLYFKEFAPNNKHPLPITIGSSIRINTDLNIRKGPGVQYDIIAYFRSGSIAKVVEIKGSWIKVVFILDSQSRSGWINGKYTTRY